MSARMQGLGLVLLSCAAVLAGCNVVDPVEDLKDYTDECRLNEHCAPGFTCVESRCVTGAGAACVEGFEPEPCELTAGVCAGAKRSCTGGTSEQRCTEASYGSSYEEVEVSCGDGLDNDCDGLAEVRAAKSFPLAWNAPGFQSMSSLRMVRFGTGYLAAWIRMAFSGGTWNEASIAYRVIDSQLQPRSVGGQVGGISTLPVQVVDDQGNTIQSTSYLSSMQIVPYDQGAFLVWAGYDAQTRREYRRIARLEVDASAAAGAAVVLAARDFPVEGLSIHMPVHAAVAADRSRMLITWVQGNQVLGRTFGLDLAPTSAAVPLSAPLEGDPSEPLPGGQSPLDVSPHGLSDFALAWGSSPSASRRVVRFRTVSGALDQLGQVVGSDVSGWLYDVRLLAAQRPEDPPLAAWLTLPSSSTASGVTAAATSSGLVVASPFSPAGPSGPSVSLAEQVSSLNITRDGDSFVMVYPQQQGSLVLRRIAADGSSQVRPLGVISDPSSATVLTDAVPGMWTVMVQPGNGPQLVSACRL